MKKIKRALISVSDKKDLKPLLSVLKKFKIWYKVSLGTKYQINENAEQ